LLMIQQRSTERVLACVDDPHLGPTLPTGIRR
jgi:hypothetical protein